MSEEKLRILAAGDLHSDASIAEKLAEKAEKNKVDLVILTGDITNFDTVVPNIMGPFVKRQLKVLLIPGNHDSFATTDFLTEMYGLKNIHGYAVQYKGVGIFGCGGANIGPQAPLDEQEIEDILGKGFKSIEKLKKKIMVTHVHPSEVKADKFSRFLPGSPGVKNSIDKFKPDILLCSHVHEAEGLEEKVGDTLVVNVGRKGKIIEI